MHVLPRPNASPVITPPTARAAAAAATLGTEGDRGEMKGDRGEMKGDRLAKGAASNTAASSTTSSFFVGGAEGVSGTLWLP